MGDAAPMHGVGTTITFGSSGWAPSLTDIDLPDIEREELEYRLLNPATEGATAYGNVNSIPGGYRKNATFEIEYLFDSGVPAPVKAVAETITITFPGSDTWAFTGYVMSEANPSLKDGVLIARATIAVNGAITKTAAA